jgi:hypothetical protein
MKAYLTYILRLFIFLSNSNNLYVYIFIYEKISDEEEIKFEAKLFGFLESSLFKKKRKELSLFQNEIE